MVTQTAKLFMSGRSQAVRRKEETVTPEETTASDAAGIQLTVSAS